MMDKLISQQAAIDKIKKRLFETAFNNVGIKQNVDETLADVAENRLENWFGELPSAEPDTTTHGPIPVKNGRNDEDRTTDDYISRRQAIDVLHGYFDGMLETDTVCPADIYGLFECMPSAQPETNCSEIPNN